MILSCPACPKTYDVPSSALPPGGREVACSACKTVWFERGRMARAAAIGAAGADVATLCDDVIDAEFQAVGPDAPRADPPAHPQIASEDDAPAPSPAKAQQTALTVAYEAVPEGPSEAEARAAVRLLAQAGRARLRRGRDRAAAIVGFALGSMMDAAGRMRARPSSSSPATSGDAAARASRARMRARAANAMTPGRAFGWAIWTGAAVSAVFAVTVKADAVRAVFPPSANLYALAAPPAPVAPDLRLGAELRAFAMSSQGPAVMVAGTVRNDGEAALLPAVTMTVRTPDGETSQPVSLPPVMLPPGGERRFTVRALVPSGASAVRLSVAAGEPLRRDGFALQPQGGGWASSGHAGPPRAVSSHVSPSQAGGAQGAAPR